MRILYLTTDLQRGGLPLRLFNLVRRLRTRGVEPVVGCLTGRGPLSAAFEVEGIETFDCGGAGGWDVRCLGRLTHAVRRVDPDLIHASLFHANLAARLCGRMDRWRPVITSTVTIEVERRWHRAIEGLSCGLSTLHIANAVPVARHLMGDLGFPPNLVRVIPNGIDLGALAAAHALRRADFGLRDDLPLVVWAGRMDPVKNLGTWVDVIERLSRRTAVQAVLIGDGPERGRLQSLVEKRGLSSAVRFTGWSENVAGWLKAADALLFPSRTEGCPNVVLEAMACGCPVVVSRIPAHEDIVEDGVSGRLCVWDDAEAMGVAVADVLKPERRRMLAAAARRFVTKRHRLDHVTDAWMDLYRSSLNGFPVGE